MPHPTRLIRHGPFEAEVDEDLAPLVLGLWRAGIETASACQDEGESDAEVGDAAGVGRRGRAYVEFVTLDDALRFYDLAAAEVAEAEDLYARMGNHAAAGAWEALSAQRALSPVDQKINDAVLALVALGFKQVEAHETVRGAVAALGEKATLEEVVRACLKKG